MARFFFLLWLVFIHVNLFAQAYIITGKVMDQNTNKLAYVHVLLLDKDNAVRYQASTDSTGFFVMEANAGHYQLKFTQFGQELLLKDIQITEDQYVGDIAINAARQMEDVVVHAKRNLIERKVDRMIFHVEDSPAMQGFDLSEALANTPMLQASDVGVSIVGKNGVAVMINERLINLTGSELMLYLKTLRSDDVASIEVITTPPAKYDAQGNSGLINIVLKKKTKNGLQATLSSDYMQRTYGSIINNANLKYQSEKLLFSFGVNHYDIAYRVVSDYDIVGSPTSTLQSDLQKDYNDGVGININLDYAINKSANVGILYNGSIGRSNIDMNSSTDYLNNTLLDSTLLTYAEHRKFITYQTISSYYDLNLDTSGRKLSFVGNFLHNSPRSPIEFTTDNMQSGYRHIVRTENDMSYQIISGQADLTYPTDAINLEMGLKYTDINNASFVRYLNLMEDVYIIDPSRSNTFDYTEKIYAAYISGFREFNSYLSAQAGLRYEYTDLAGFSPESGESNTFKYHNLFPSAYINFIPNNRHTLSIAYSRRINRPSFSYLNPFRWYFNPYVYSSGNPNLLPSFNNNLELGYVYRGNLALTLYHQRLRNGFTSLSFLEGITRRSVWENHLRQYNSGLNISYSFTRFNWLQSSLFSNLVYIQSESSFPDVIGQSGLTCYYQINNSFFLNKEKTISLLLNYWQNLPRRANNGLTLSYANLRSGINVGLLDKRLQMHLVADDIFRQTVLRGERYFQDNTQFFNSYSDARRVTISATYRIGKSDVKTNRRSTKFDESGRAN